jgi:beta-glucanase (GH16 family)
MYLLRPRRSMNDVRAQPSRRRKPSTQSYQASPVLLLSLLILLPLVCADWIDPDTPWDSRTAQPLNVKPPAPQRSDEKSSSHHHHHHHKPTTPAPTITTAPSHSPTESPTAFPTYIPKTFELVFSDEFNTPFRKFDDGQDPRWTAIEKNDYTNDALHYYTAANARTNEHGELVISSEAGDTDIVGFDDAKKKRTHVTKHFKSAMVQSWNKFCFTGGIIEAEVTLPGKSEVGGLWPAFWLLGNLARHTYVGSSEHIWPWSSQVCNNQSKSAQLVSGCDRVAHYGFEPYLGRGSPEIDIFEVQPGNIKHNTGPFAKSSVGQPFMSSSFQVAPGRSYNRPGPGEWPGPDQWYGGLEGGPNTSLNILFYGTYNHFLNDVNPIEQDYWSDAISYNRQLDESHFNSTHVYRLEWDVPDENSDGYLHWFIDGELVVSMNGTSIKDAGLGSEVSTEPSYIIFNTAISKQWGFPQECPTNCPCKIYDCNSDQWQKICGFSEGFCKMMKADKPEYKINWVRVYQDPNNPTQKVGCSTPERPTRKFIKAHQGVYKTPQDTFPLKGIQRGRGTCNPSGTGVLPANCGGGRRGRCTPGNECECKPGWTGPNCLAHEGSDPIFYDEPDRIADVGFAPPKITPSFLFIGLGVLVFLFLMSVHWKHRMEGWKPVPDADVKRTYLQKPSTRAKASFHHERTRTF